MKKDVKKDTILIELDWKQKINIGNNNIVLKQKSKNYILKINFYLYIIN